MSEIDQKKVVVMGLGYVGLPLAMRASEVGFFVVGYEPNARRVERLLVGESYVEDVGSSSVTARLADGSFVPTTDISLAEGFDVAVVTVPTPLSEGSPDISAVEEAARIVAPYIRPGATVILESTTYPGTTREVLVPALEAGSGLIGGKDFFVGFSPERIEPGHPVYGLRNIPKIVSGLNEASLFAVQAFFDQIVDKTVAVSSTDHAEFAKLLENTFRLVNIALVNEMAMFTHELGLDLWEILDAASTKPFGYMPFKPGPGVGGHCLPIDPCFLSWRLEQSVGRPSRFIELAKDVNDGMPAYVVNRASVLLNNDHKSVNGSRILLLGLTYRADTSDVRESPGLSIAKALSKAGAIVLAIDPHVACTDWPEEVERLSQDDIGATEFDLTILVTDHTAFAPSLMCDVTSPVLDTRHRLDKAPHVTYL